MYSGFAFSGVRIFFISGYIPVLTVILFLCSYLFAFTTNSTLPETFKLMANMKKAYAGVYDYQATIEIRTYRRNTNFDGETFLYRFKKPYQLRIDVQSPRKGVSLVYPDRDGKVVVRLPGFARFFKLRLSPDSFLLSGSAGQSINKTDLGLLIENIGHSLSDQAYSTPHITHIDCCIITQVVAQNHFREEVITEYTFYIDKQLWLPVRVEESTPGGQLERVIVFKDLTVNIGLSDDMFVLHGP